MLAHLLVPLDGTPQSAVSLLLARTLARVNGARIHLLRVVREPPDDGMASSALEYLRRIVPELTAGGLRVGMALRVGDPAREILAESAASHADMIVMGSHGRVGLRRAVLGSVSERVLRDSQVPVALVRPGGHRPDRLCLLLVPVDGTPGSALAIAAARSLAQDAHARVILAEVVAPLPRFGEGCYIDPGWEEDTRRAAQARLDRTARALTRSSVPAEAVTRIGPIVGTLSSLADEVDADLVVMSTHALTGASRTLLGSVADDVVRHCSRPVLLIKQPRSTPAGRTGEGARATEETAART